MSSSCWDPQPAPGMPRGDVRGPGPWSWRRECCWRRPPRPGCWERRPSSARGLCPGRSPGGNGPGSPGGWQGPVRCEKPWNSHRGKEGLPPASPSGRCWEVPKESPPASQTQSSPHWRHPPPGHRSCHHRCPGTQSVSHPAESSKTWGGISPPRSQSTPKSSRTLGQEIRGNPFMEKLVRCWKGLPRAGGSQPGEWMWHLGTRIVVASVVLGDGWTQQSPRPFPA